MTAPNCCALDCTAPATVQIWGTADRYDYSDFCDLHHWQAIGFMKPCNLHHIDPVSGEADEAPFAIVRAEEGNTGKWIVRMVGPTDTASPDPIVQHMVAASQGKGSDG